MRLTIRNKLYGGFGITLGFLLIVSVIAYVSLGSVANGTADVQTAARLDDAIMSMQIALLDGQKIESAALASGDAAAVRAEFDITVQDFDDA